MPYGFSWIQNLGPAGVVLEAILLTLTGIALLLAFILLRRGWRSRIFRRRDRRAVEVRDVWDGIVSGRIPAEEWRDDRLSCEIVESMLLDRLEVSTGDEARRLLDCLRVSGLLDLRIQDARQRHGWRRRRALASLGRMRAPEAVPALSEALDDPGPNDVLTAIRGLGRLGLPEAAVPILDRLVAGQFASLPAIPIQNALVSCCQSRPQVLVPYVHRASAEFRPLIARALGELASGSLDEDDLVLLACDEQSEVRASAARALATAPFGAAISVLGALAEDDEWFVRLRATVALGQLEHPRAISMLVDRLCDPNRFVRLRAATGLSRLDADVERVLDLAEGRGDRYALQALISELEASGTILRHIDALGSEGAARERAERILLRVLQLGAHRLLVSALTGHRHPRVRHRVARLLGHSGVAGIVPLIEQAAAAERSARRRAVFAWVLERLRPPGDRPVRKSRRPPRTGVQ